MQEFFAFGLMPRVLYKAGLVSEMGQEIQRLGGKRVFIVADEGVQSTGLLKQVEGALEGSVDVVGVFTDVPPNSSIEVVEKGAALARECGTDMLIAVGGGSPLDTAKCMRMLITLDGRLLDYEGYNILDGPLVPLVAVPTTAGTGSEVTPFAVIRDQDRKIKLTFSSPFLAPNLAILDPLLTRTMPPKLTAATGMDALTHAIETFVSTDNNPISDSLALQAIDMIGTNLREATYTGDLEPRGQMLLASCMAGIAFSNSFLGIVHAMAHAVGGMFEIHHGTANAILLPHGMLFNSVVVPNRYGRIARALGVNAGGRSETEVIADGIAAVVTLTQDCGLPTKLRDAEVPHEALGALVDAAMGDAAIFNNPRSVAREDLLELFEAAW